MFWIQIEYHSCTGLLVYMYATFKPHHQTRTFSVVDFLDDCHNILRLVDFPDDCHNSQSRLDFGIWSLWGNGYILIEYKLSCILVLLQSTKNYGPMDSLP